ncbi:hypothetical protein [Asticcacaulis excentricus]|uniref:Uncharacterized protein n=1 Tax=Asticcacaulis excentricus TaxID=78587 RepID=A0A3G9G4K7_9CAUL|nr:hypothetical protein [Asticcacaulis excentricus]BBF79894.1 hypothetical protein EM6_0471 [Asticcacaulis excentricus]
MTEPIDLLAPIPVGDGPRRIYAKQRTAMARLAQRVAFAALLRGPAGIDLITQVYCAGLYHGSTLNKPDA